MSCYICGCEEYLAVFNKPEIGIWTNSGDCNRYDIACKCTLRQCRNCGHVYQPVDDDLGNILKKIYLSKNAQVSTALGKVTGA